jgi:diguanylate cyclase (GGDEF)-like protein
MDVPGFWWLSLAQIVLAALLFGAAWARTSVRWLRAFTLLGAIAAVTAAIFLNGEREGGPALMNEFFYVWPAVYAGYFYSRETIAGVLAGIIAAYCAVLLVIGVGTEVFAYRLMVTISVVAGTAATAHALRLQVNSLLSRLGQMATTDSLTSLLNRRAFDDRLRSETERARRNSEPLALVVGDIDRFKELNDHYGHPCGDQVLADVGRLLLESSRAVDVVARIGGEEFALVLPATSPVQAFEVAERLRHRIASLRDPGGNPVTMSFGVVVAPGGGAAVADDMLEASDLALYAAKDRGRDQTVVYDDSLTRKPFLQVVPAV